MSKLPPVLQNMSLPVIGSPLFIISNPKLVIEQCKAGVVGSMPALNARPAELLDEWLAEITETLVQQMHAAGQARQPGDRRYQQRAESERHGIAIDSEELARLRGLAAAPQPPAG